MQFIVIGLGNFGSALASKLTSLGHEVIGVDSDMHKVESFKNKITHTICLDCTDATALATLPLTDTDVAIVSIGEDFGASLLATALLQQMNVKRIISRSLSPLHKTILEAIGITELVHPEEESAERLAKTLDIADILDSFDLFSNYKVVEAALPERYMGQTVAEADLTARFGIKLLAVIKMIESRNVFGVGQTTPTVKEEIHPDTKFEEGDLIVVFGKVEKIKHFLDTQ